MPSALMFFLWLVAASPVWGDELLTQGDAAWARRGDGQIDGRAALQPITAAVDLYEKALAAAPRNLEAHWKLMRAIYFLGDYATPERDQKQEIFDRGRQVSESALRHLAEAAGGHQRLADMPAAEIARALADQRHEATRVYFWSAVSWGLWGEAFGKLAAARQGVASRLRLYTETVIALDPEYEDGGGHRIYGRLHSEAPKIPFVTGWVDRAVAIAELEKAVGISPEDPLNRLYLAEALLDHRPSREDEAVRLLEQLAALEPRLHKIAEDSRSRLAARRRLAATRAER